MVLTITIAAAATLAAAATALAGGGVSQAPAAPFGGSKAVLIAQVGHVEVDLLPFGSGDLRRVACAGVGRGAHTCYVAR